MADLGRYDGRATTDYASIVGLTIPVAEPVWKPLTRSMLEDPTLAPTFDPLGVHRSLTIDDATGDVTFDINRIAGTGTPATMAFYRLRRLPGWVGDGSWMIAWRFTPLTLHVTQYFAAVAGMCGQGGDPNPADANPGGLGVAITALNDVWVTVCTVNAGALPSPTTLGDLSRQPKAVGWIIPGGRVGDETHVGPQDGRWVTARVGWSLGASAVSANSLLTDGATVTGGYCPWIGTGWYSGGSGGSAVVTVRYEWTLAPHWPAGEWPL